MGDSIFVGHLLRLGQIAPDQRHHFHAVDQLDTVKVFDAECAGTGQGYFDGHRIPLMIF